MAVSAMAQTAVPHVFTTNIPIPWLNENFAVSGADKLNISGGNLTGNVTANAGVTIDGIDVGQVLGGSGTASFLSLGTTSLGVTGNMTVLGSISIQNAAPTVDFYETGASSNAGWTRVAMDSNFFQIQFLNDDGSIGSGPWNIQRSGSTGTAMNIAVTEVQNAGRYNSAAGQPYFLAYNSATDTGLGTGDNTVDLDTELYDTTNSFSSDTFTAPIAGVYHFCASGYSTATNQMTWKLAFSDGAEFIIGLTNAGLGIYEDSGCVQYYMNASAYMLFRAYISSASSTINGGVTAGAGIATWMSGRLVP